MDLSEYCRELETYLCRKNDGHLIRIVGPSFEKVSRWASDGVPLKVALAGVDRYFERYYRQGPRRRPVRIDFCEADVLDVFDEWRRATGVSSARGSESADEQDPPPARRKGPSLREHLERVLVRLSSLRASGVLAEGADALIDAVSLEFDAARNRSATRGGSRQAMMSRLEELDQQLVTLVLETAPAAMRDEARGQAIEELTPFRATMRSEAYARAEERAFVRALRERLQIPVIAFT